MIAFTNSFARSLLDLLFRQTSITIDGLSLQWSATTDNKGFYLGFFTTPPTPSGAGTEVSSTDTGYSRYRIEVSTDKTMAAAATANDVSTSANAAALTIKAAATVAGMGTVTHWGLFDASTTGNLLIYGSLTNPVTVGADDTFVVAAGDLQISF